jgi:hypothetical protein
MRDLQAFLSFALFGALSCAELIKRTGDPELYLPTLLYTGQGPICDALRGLFNPASVSHPVWDERLMNGDTLEADWVKHWHSETNALPLTDVRSFTARKRAFYLCHTNGSDLLKISGTDAEAFLELLELPDRECIRAIIRLINVFFGIRDETEALRIWMSHRYNQQPRTVLCSSSRVQRKDLEIARPLLSTRMKAAFDVATDHVVLRLKSESSYALRMDYEMFQLLNQSQKGAPTLFIENAATRRLWRFMEQLAGRSGEPDDEVRVTVQDTVSSKIISFTVDRTAGTYLSVELEDRR